MNLETFIEKIVEATITGVPPRNLKLRYNNISFYRDGEVVHIGSRVKDKETATFLEQDLEKANGVTVRQDSENYFEQYPFERKGVYQKDLILKLKNHFLAGRRVSIDLGTRHIVYIHGWRIMDLFTTGGWDFQLAMAQDLTLELTSLLIQEGKEQQKNQDYLRTREIIKISRELERHLIRNLADLVIEYLD